MLNYALLKQRSLNFIKSNFYFDYGIKQLSRAFLHNFLIQLAFFFAEKFVIEYYSRFSFNYSAITFNKISISLKRGNMFIYIVLLGINTLLLLI